MSNIIQFTYATSLQYSNVNHTILTIFDYMKYCSLIVACLYSQQHIFIANSQTQIRYILFSFAGMVNTSY